jgi:chromosome segregation ATPase
MPRQIKTSDIYQDTGELKKLSAELEAIQLKLEALRNEARILDSTMTKLNTTTNAQQSEIKRNAKQADEIQKRYVKYNDSLTENAKKISALKNAQRQINQVNKLEAKLLAAKEGSYNRPERSIFT